MPKQWTAVHDQKMLAYILKNCNVKVSHDELARVVGEDTTPKAIKHRLDRIKKTLVEENDTGSSQDANTANKRKNPGDHGITPSTASKRAKTGTDDDESDVTPSKGAKKTQKGKKPVSNGNSAGFDSFKYSQADDDEKQSLKQEGQYLEF